MVHSHEFQRQQQEIQKKYTELYGSQVCVFLKKGTFYEFQGQQDPESLEQFNTVKQVTDLFGIVCNIQPNDGPNGTTGLFAGVPDHTLDKWAGKLTRNGWTVVVVDEVKNGAGKVSRREVTKILSPGTHVESAETAESFQVACVWFDIANSEALPSYGVSTIDLTTGEVFLYEGQSTGRVDFWHTDELRHFFQVHPPREIVIQWSGSGLHRPTEETLRRAFSVGRAPFVEGQLNWVTNTTTTTRAEYLKDLFKPQSALPLRTWLRLENDGNSIAEASLVSLLRFCEEHVVNISQQLRAPQFWHPQQNLQVLNNALSQLNFVPTETQSSVSDCFQKPITAMGKRNLTHVLCTPLADPAKIKDRLSQVDWMLQNRNTIDKRLASQLSLIQDLPRLHRSMIRGTTTPTEVLQLEQSYTAIRHCLVHLAESPCAAPPEIKNTLEQSLVSLHKWFDTEKALKAQKNPDDWSCLPSAIAPCTAAAEKTCADVLVKAQDWLTELCKLANVDLEAASFKPTDKTEFTVGITKANAKVMELNLKRVTDTKQLEKYKGLQWKQLSSGARIEHPALDSFENTLAANRAHLQREIAKELPTSCIGMTLECREGWPALEDWITDIDIRRSFANTAVSLGWIAPTIDATEGPSSVSIKNLRHPLIEAQKTRTQQVTHDVNLGQEDTTGWLLYGMNASGKSSLMKAIGIAVLLAQVGSQVPATAMHLRPFQRIATRILNQDNLWAGLSSFAVEMSELREILQVADPNTLVLGDELCAGTESISGTAIVAAGIQQLHRAKARFVLATHLHDLMKLPVITEIADLRVWHLHVEYDPITDRLMQHRNLMPGPGSTLYGLEVAKALHLPDDLIRSAQKIRRTLLGEAAAEETQRSQQQAQLQLKKCEVCSVPISKELEVHHIQQQAAARGGRNADGTALHGLRNLIVVCQKCHYDHHRGNIAIGPMIDTSHGPIRSVQSVRSMRSEPEADEPPATPSALSPSSTPSATPQISPQSGRKLTITTTQASQIRTLAKEQSGLHKKLLIFQIEQQMGLTLTAAQLKRILDS